MKILVFTEGTILMQSDGNGSTRSQRVDQSEAKLPSVYDYKNYIPCGNPVDKIRIWRDQKAEIYYLTSRVKLDEIDQIRNVLKKYQFPDYYHLLYRQVNQEYHEIAEKLMPDIIVEDDCESIGGKVEMVYSYIRPDLKGKIKPIIIKEFDGIDHLPDKLSQLLNSK